MFPALPQLPPLSGRTVSPNFISVPGGIPGPGGGPVIISPPVDKGTGGGSGRAGIGTVKIYDSNGRCVSGCDAIDKGLNDFQQTSSILDIPWGRIAAFLLGLILIAGGIYLSKQMQQAVKVVQGHARKAAEFMAAA